MTMTLVRRKTVSAVALLVLPCVLLAACGGSGDATSATPTTASDSRTTATRPSAVSSTTETTIVFNEATCRSWMTSMDTAVPDAASVGKSTASQRTALQKAGGGLHGINSQYAASWMPTSWFAKSTRPVMVSLPGTGGYPEAEWTDWHTLLEKNGWAFIGLNYRTGSQYDSDGQMYVNLKRLVDDFETACGRTSNVLVLEGFSRGAAMLGPMAVQDRKDKKLFSGFLGLSGGWTSSDNLYPSIENVPNDAVGGQRFWFWYGGADKDDYSNQTRKQVFTTEKDWLVAHGGVMDAFVEKPGAAHHDWTKDTTNMTAALTWGAGLAKR